MPTATPAAAPPMPTAAPAPAMGWAPPDKPPAAPADPMKPKKKKQPTERKTMCWLKRADLPGSATPQYPAIWVMQKCMDYGIHEIAPYDSQKTAKWNDVINEFHSTWGAIYPAAATAAKAAIEAQVTKVLDGYKEFAKLAAEGKASGTGTIKNYALSPEELDAVRIYLTADLGARQQRETANETKPKANKKRVADEEGLLDVLGGGKKAKAGPAGGVPKPAAVMAGKGGVAPMSVVEELQKAVADLSARVKALEDAK